MKKLRVKKLKKQSAIITDNNIKGAFVTKRAVEVALVGNHSIAFIGSQGCGKTIFRDFIFKINPALITYESKLCLCGNYGHKIRPCTCTVNQIKRFRKRKKFQQCLTAEIIIECVQPREKEMLDKYLWKFELRKIEEYQKCWQFDKHAQELLAYAVKGIGLNLHQRKFICEVAKTIAFMDSDLIVKTQHVAEAIQYQAFQG